MKKTTLLVISVLFASIVYGQYDEKARSILDAMSTRYSKINSYKAKIISSLINESDGINEEMTGEITVKGDKFRLKLDGQEIYNDGSTVWTYLSEANEVNIDNYNSEEEIISPSKIYNAYKDGYKYVHLSESTVEGLNCDEIDLVPENAKDNQFFKIKMFISQKDRSLVSWVMFEKSGNKYKYTINDFKTGMTVTDSYFKFNTTEHPGVEVVDLR
ncbi:MAG: outer membrane lipoprotein carrier protein LolA [Cyclobacteriaceae bacterium]|nr:outer membrane lipoprotein carrier protein LolA [Cyclobacteriaceae bacterium]